MTAAVACFIFGALTFWEQEVLGLRVGPVKPLSGDASVNCRQSDLDGDGAVDLVFAEEVAFQRRGGFPADARAPLPSIPAMAALDVWKGALYLRSSRRLAVFRWNGVRWAPELDQELDWPGPGAVGGIEAPEDSIGARFQRFLHDVDGDGIPEVVAVGESGVDVYRMHERYELFSRLNVLPALSLTPGLPEPIWPPSARRITFPARQMSCRVFLEGPVFSVLVREDTTEGRVCYRRTTHFLDLDSETPEQPYRREEATSRALPDCVSPCRLNGDRTIDYAGGRWDISTAPAFPMLIYETWASLDGGSTFAMRRTPSFQGFRPQCSFVDFEGDGDLDLLTEGTGIFEGGFREAINRFITHRSVSHTLQVYPQVQGEFSKTPALHVQLRIGLERPPVMNDRTFLCYLSGELVNITGDFNRDGYKDLAVQDKPGNVSVYLAAGFRYPERPDAVLRLPPGSRFAVVDVNGDGRSDIVVRWIEESSAQDNLSSSGTSDTERCSVYYAAEAGT